MSLLDQLKTMTTVVADTGDIDAIAQYQPQDATTNPSLIYKAASDERYQPLIDDALAWTTEQGGSEEGKLDLCLDRLFVNFGKKILDIVPGRVSTEVMASLSFDTEATIARAHRIIGMYEEAGIDRHRVLIKIASTWEGIRAADVLEDEGIHCNLTLMFSLAQAVACAEAGITLISPFVGRIYDWFKSANGGNEISPQDDPGVDSVASIYNYYKKFGHNTEIMGASFRKLEQITELAGCDLLTISPDLLQNLADQEGDLPRKLNEATAKASNIERIDVSEGNFRWLMNEDAMATEKLAEGIRKFHVDAEKLRAMVAERMGVGV